MRIGVVIGNRGTQMKPGDGEEMDFVNVISLISPLFLLDNNQLASK